MKYQLHNDFSGIGRYELDPGGGGTTNPVALAPYPYQQTHMAPHLLGGPRSGVPAGAQHHVLGATGDSGAGMKTFLAVIGVGILLWLLFAKDLGVRSNPGNNKVARLLQSSSGAWYYKLMRKRAKRHGPFASRESAAAAAEARGYEVLR